LTRVVTGRDDLRGNPSNRPLRRAMSSPARGDRQAIMTTMKRNVTDRALVIGLTVGAKANNPIHASNRASEASFRAMLGDSVELFGIDLQMNFRGKPDPNECSPSTILEDATDLVTLETFPVMRDGGFSLITFDSHTEQYCKHFARAPLVLMYYLDKLRVGGRYIMSARVEMMDFVTPTVDFGHEQNRGVLRSYWEKDDSLRDAFTLEYLKQHAGIHPTISDPLIVITRKAGGRFVKVEEALKQMREARAR
jgi:hypothetical protein